MGFYQNITSKYFIKGNSAGEVLGSKLQKELIEKGFDWIHKDELHFQNFDAIHCYFVDQLMSGEDSESEFYIHKDILYELAFKMQRVLKSDDFEKEYFEQFRDYKNQLWKMGDREDAIKQYFEEFLDWYNNLSSTALANLYYHPSWS